MTIFYKEDSEHRVAWGLNQLELKGAVEDLEDQEDLEEELKVLGKQLREMLEVLDKVYTQ